MAFLGGPMNFVQSFLANPCARPFYIYVVTFVPAFFDAWLMVRLLDFDDIVRSRGSYLGRKGYSPTGRGKKHTAKARGKAPPQNREKYARAGIKHLITFTQPLENLGLALLMYGAVNRFYYDWQYYLDLSESCIDGGFAGPLVRTTDGDRVFPNASGNAIRLENLVQNAGNWGTNQFGCSPPIGRYDVILAATVKGPGGGASYRVKLSVFGGSVEDGGDSESVYCAPGSETDLLAKWSVFFASTTQLRSIGWLIAGPGVPVGLEVTKARVIISRSQSFFQ